MSEWINVSDRLPDIIDDEGWSDEVLILTNIGAAVVVSYNEAGYWDAFAHDFQTLSESVAYWMPVPPAPKVIKAWQDMTSEEYCAYRNEWMANNTND